MLGIYWSDFNSVLRLFFRRIREVSKLDDNYMFVTPGFFTGVARTLDVGGGMVDSSFLTSPSAEEADARAVRNDWRAVGEDLDLAMSAHGEKKEP